jgi:hypothetical protein
MMNDGAAETAKAVKLFKAAARKLEGAILELENGGDIHEHRSLDEASLAAARGVDRLYSRAAKGEIAGDDAAREACNAECDRLHALRVASAEKGRAYRRARLSVALDMAVTREREARTRPVDGALAAYQREIALSRIG